MKNNNNVKNNIDFGGAASASEKLRVLILVRALDIGGAERQVIVLARGLQRLGHQVRVAVFYRSGRLEAELVATGIAIIDLRKRGRWDGLGMMRRLRKEVRSFVPHCVYSFLAPPNILGSIALVGLRTPIIFGIRASDMDLKAYDWAVRISGHLESWCAIRAARIVVNSEKGRKTLGNRRFPMARVTVIRNGIDTTRFQPNPQARLKERRLLCVAPEEKLIAAIGRLDPMKDHANFIRAAAIMNRSRGDLRFLVMGDGSAEAALALKAQADAAGLDGRFNILPGRPDVEYLYPALDVIVLSSRFGEGFPNVLAEAMACGVRAVSTRVGDAAAILGGDALLAEPGNAEELAAAALRVLYQAPEEPPEQRIRRLFPEASMIAATEKVLKEVAFCH